MLLKEYEETLNGLYYIERRDLTERLDPQTVAKVCQHFVTKLDTLEANFHNCFFNNFKKLSFKAKVVFVDLLKETETKADLVALFTINKNGKIKTGFNYEPYIFCRNMHSGGCDLCGVCYSAKQELAHRIKGGLLSVPSLRNSFKNYLLVYYVLFSGEWWLLREAVTQSRIWVNSERKDTAKVLNGATFRYNIKSDIESQAVLNLFNYLNGLLLTLCGVRYIYTYTKTKGLNFANCHELFIINKSGGLVDTLEELQSYEGSPNSYLTVTKEFYEAHKEYIKKTFWVCGCNGCGACLNPCWKANKKPTICILH